MNQKYDGDKNDNDIYKLINETWEEYNDISCAGMNWKLFNSPDHVWVKYLLAHCIIVKFMNVFASVINGMYWRRNIIKNISENGSRFPSYKKWFA